MSANGLQCVTCRQRYDDPHSIYSQLLHFEGMCICWNCVSAYRQTGTPVAHMRTAGSAAPLLPAGPIEETGPDRG
ncbi:MAG TPA: hypothetical protein VGM83_08525 [Devosiaceae bacterium]|jgi:hypothetical protein